MKYVLTVRGDMNDADYVEESLTLDLDSNPFQGWSEELDKSLITWKDILEALGDSISEYEAVKNKERSHYHNWDEDAQAFIFKSMTEKLKVGESVTVDELQELTWDLFPGSCDYPVHTILSISAMPETDVITFY